MILSLNIRHNFIIFFWSMLTSPWKDNFKFFNSLGQASCCNQVLKCTRIFWFQTYHHFTESKYHLSFSVDESIHFKTCHAESNIETTELKQKFAECGTKITETHWKFLLNVEKRILVPQIYDGCENKDLFYCNLKLSWNWVVQTHKLNYRKNNKKLDFYKNFTFFVFRGHHYGFGEQTALENIS